MEKTIEGSCLCGEVSFTFCGDISAFYLCYCQHCQKDTGTAHAANLFSNAGSLTWCTGRQFVKSFTLPNTRHTKSFCQHCGSAVPTEDKALELIVIPAGSIDTPIAMLPNAKIFTRSYVSWIANSEHLPSFETFPK